MFIRYAATHSRPSEIFRRADIKTVFGANGKCRRNYSLPTLEVAGSNPASAANYGRVAQRIERVKISPLFVAQCATPYGRMLLGLHSFLATNPNDPN